MSESGIRVQCCWFGLVLGFDIIGIGVGRPFSTLCFGGIILGVVVCFGVGVWHFYRRRGLVWRQGLASGLLSVYSTGSALGSGLKFGTAWCLDLAELVSGVGIRVWLDVGGWRQDRRRDFCSESRFGFRIDIGVWRQGRRQVFAWRCGLAPVFWIGVGSTPGFGVGLGVNLWLGVVVVWRFSWHQG